MSVEEKAVQNFKELLAISTENPPGDEVLIVSWVEGKLKELGISGKRIWNKNPERSSFVATVQGTGNGAVVGLSSHMDTVPEGDRALWSARAGEEKEGFIWGRGAIDMKYKIAFDLALLETLSGKNHRPVELILLCDEECGSELGAKFLLSQKEHPIRASVVTNEVGGSFTYLPWGKVIAPIQCGERGVATVRIDITAEGGHASFSHRNDAISKAQKFLSALNRKSNFNFSKLSQQFFEGVLGSASVLLSNSIVASKVFSLLPKTLGAQLEGMLFCHATPTMIQSGTTPNALPEHASITLDLRFLPQVGFSAVKTELEQLAQKFGGVVTVLYCAEGYDSGESVESKKIISLYQEAIGKKAQVLPALLPISSDNSHFARAGITPVGFAPLHFTKNEPGFDCVHAVNERVSRDAFISGLQSYLAVMHRFLAE